MPVNGLLLRMSADATLAEVALGLISKCPEVEMAPARDSWQPLVADTPDVSAAHDFHEWLEALPGVEQVDVIYVGFDEPHTAATLP